MRGLQPQGRSCERAHQVELGGGANSIKLKPASPIAQFHAGLSVAGLRSLLSPVPLQKATPGGGFYSRGALPGIEPAPGRREGGDRAGRPWQPPACNGRAGGDRAPGRAGISPQEGREGRGRGVGRDRAAPRGRLATFRDAGRWKAAPLPRACNELHGPGRAPPPLPPSPSWPVKRRSAGRGRQGGPGPDPKAPQEETPPAFRFPPAGLPALLPSAAPRGRARLSSRLGDRCAGTRRPPGAEIAAAAAAAPAGETHGPLGLSAPQATLLPQRGPSAMRKRGKGLASVPTFCLSG
ncbi:gametogenetin-like [Sphaerodactylus townsendi]|uniref:gametogenetin-like n=1 Tax=Sphaerodactylus townsendi TaxID=933632 RepID=UPI002025E829|nr:gametogenetin-like [Sphaerodactylus townsendi]